MNDVVLDASALLAILQDEPGSAIVRKALAELPCAISAVNLSEVVAKLTDYNVPVERIRQALEPLPVEIHPFDERDAFAADLLRTIARPAGLSFADRACLALAQRLQGRVLTADRAFASVEAGLDVEVIRRPDR